MVDGTGLQNRRLASCDVNGAFDSHTLPPSFINDLQRFGIASGVACGDFILSIVMEL